MLKLSSVLLLLVACAAHDPAVDKRLDTLSAEIAQLRQEVEQQQKQPPPPAQPQPPTAPVDLDRRLDALDKRLDQLAAQRPPPPRRRPEPDRNQVYAVAVDGYPSEGPADAKVTMVLAFDYADPYTEKSRDSRVELRKKYGKDLRIVYRDFVVHPQVATAAALGGCAAHKQKQFINYDAIAWSDGFKARNFDSDPKCVDTAAGCPVTLGFAKSAHLDLARFKTDMVACEGDLKADMAELQKFGVGATPSFFINGRFTSGAMPIENYAALIDDELKKANDRIAGGSKAASYYKDWVLAKGLKQLDP